MSHEVCVCGHVTAHHGPLASECHWRGCGCPRFVRNDNESAAESDTVAWRWANGAYRLVKPS